MYFYVYIDVFRCISQGDKSATADIVLATQGWITATRVGHATPKPQSVEPGSRRLRHSRGGAYAPSASRRLGYRRIAV
jgi:hypothetical protein